MFSKNYHKILFSLYSSLFFVTPLLFTPITDEIFELPKMILVYVLGTGIFFLYLTKIILEKKWVFQKTIFNRILMMILAISLVCSVFSLHSLTSFLGYYSRFSGSYLSIFYYIFLAFIFFNEISKEESKKLFDILIISTNLTAIYGILQKLGVDQNYWVEDSQARVFGTLGQPNWLAMLLIMVVPYQVILTKEAWKNKNWKEIGGRVFSLFLNILALIFTRSASGYLAIFAEAVILGMYFLSEARLSKRLKAGIGIGIALVILILIILERNNLYDLFWTKETNQIRLATWEGTLNLIKSKPLWGYGLETFPYSFLKFRPLKLNYTTEWNFLFNKPHNEFLEILSESGFIGLGSYLFLIIFTFAKAIKNWKEKDVFAITCGFMGLLICLFFGFQVVMTNLLFFIFPVMILKFSHEKEEKIERNFQFGKRAVSGALIISGILGVFLNYQFMNYLLANIYFDRGYPEKAAEMVPFENKYLRASGYIMAEEGKEEAEIYLEKAYANNPHHYLTLQTLSKSYMELALIDKKYLDKAIFYSQKQTEISPNDPEGWYQYGLFLLSVDKEDEAQTAFKKSLELKNDYTEAKEMLTL